MREGGILGAAGVRSGERRGSHLQGGRRQKWSRMPCSEISTWQIEDRRRIEILADLLPLFGGAQLAVDTTLVSALHCDGSAHPRAAHVDGAVLVTARRRKERTYPELANPRGRARLVVLAGEVGGRWSEETRQFLTLLAKARARCEPRILRRRAKKAWRLRWTGLLCCAASRASAASLLLLRYGGGCPPQPMLW